MNNNNSKQGSPFSQFFGLLEDHFRLLLLEAGFEKGNFKRALCLLIIGSIALLNAFVLLQVALIAGLMTMNIAIWQTALALAVLEIAVGLVSWIYFKRKTFRPDIFQGSRQEFQRTFQWIHQHFN